MSKVETRVVSGVKAGFRDPRLAGLVHVLVNSSRACCSFPSYSCLLLEAACFTAFGFSPGGGCNTFGHFFLAQTATGMRWGQRFVSLGGMLLGARLSLSTGVSAKQAVEITWSIAERCSPFCFEYSTALSSLQMGVF